MGREDRPGPGLIEGLVERTPRLHRLGGELQRRQRGVPFVEMHDGRVVAEGPEQSHPSDAQHRVLRQPQPGVTHVQTSGDPPVQDVVLAAARVEQVQRHAPHVDAPHLDVHVAPPKGHRHRERPPVLPGHERRRERRGVDLGPVVVLPAARVEALVVAALPVEQADPDDRQPPVRRLLQDVAREDPEAARVDRKRRVDPVLEAEERHGALAGIA